jgi:hypothetical protein
MIRLVPLEVDRMKRFIAVLVLSLSGVAITAAYAHDSERDRGDDRGHDRDHHWAAPEIDPSSAIAALTLLLGGAAVMGSRNRQKIVALPKLPLTEQQHLNRD